MKPIKVVSLDCWHANQLIYQADGRLDDGRHCYVHYRGDRFSVWVGDVPFAECGQYEGDWIFHADPRGPVSPSTITRATLASWTGDRIEWPGRIDGYHNEAEGPPGEGPIRVGEGRV